MLIQAISYIKMIEKTISMFPTINTGKTYQYLHTIKTIKIVFSSPTRRIDSKIYRNDSTFVEK